MEIVRFETGAYSVAKRHSDGRWLAMHSKVGPETEAREVYFNQSELLETLKTHREPFVIYDVGMGLASNVLATLEGLLYSPELPTQVPIKIMSFENDLTGLNLALKSDPNSFPVQHRWKELLNHLLSEEMVLITTPVGQIEWTLKLGDFFELAPKVWPANLIYYDFYDPATCPELWNAQAFRKLRSLCATHCRFITYSAATRVRSALIMSEFYVGYGKGTSAKRETTVAHTQPSFLDEPLGSRWLEHLSRSSQPLPEDAFGVGKVEALSLISNSRFVK